LCGSDPTIVPRRFGENSRERAEWSPESPIDLPGVRIRLAVNLIRYRLPEYPKVLDVGCAGGTLAGELPPSVHYLGIDASESAIEAAQSVWGGDRTGTA
jgi:2-polyprenyl-3-methyl-5-hydroxy-6-metoxy-1,4-benzoquinol methylase